MSGIDSAFDDRQHEGFDWIEWHGGEQPVPNGTKVDVILNDGTDDSECFNAEEFRWDHWGSAGDIVKYRVVEQIGPKRAIETPVPDSRIENMKREVKEVLAKYRTPMQVAGSHYTSMTVEPIDIAYLNDLSSMQLKMLKYILRYKDKDGVKDLKKAADMLRKCGQYEYGVDIMEDE